MELSLKNPFFLDRKEAADAELNREDGDMHLNREYFSTRPSKMEEGSATIAIMNNYREQILKCEQGQKTLCKLLRKTMNPRANGDGKLAEKIENLAGTIDRLDSNSSQSKKVKRVVKPRENRRRSQSNYIQKKSV
jgi:hypothetical protein